MSPFKIKNQAIYLASPYLYPLPISNPSHLWGKEDKDGDRVRMDKEGKDMRTVKRYIFMEQIMTVIICNFI